MKASEIMKYFRKIGTWVSWDDTCDQILYGSSEIEVKGIAVAWIATNFAIEKAGKKGLNLFITHESSFYNFNYYEIDSFNNTPDGKNLITKKKKLLDNYGITLIRCHDVWDRMPGFGICDKWAEFLGFKTEKRPVESYYKICLIDNLTLDELAELIVNKVKLLGQDSVKVMGDGNRIIRRMAIGTGAVTAFDEMYKFKPDVILATEDGMNHWSAGLLALDLEMPIIIVNHAISEIPGMKALAGCLQNHFSKIPVEYINTTFPYRTLY